MKRLMLIACLSNTLPRYFCGAASFITRQLPKRLSGAIITITTLPEENDIDYRYIEPRIDNVMPEELGYIYETTGSNSSKRIKQFIGGRKALREAVYAIHSQTVVPAILHDEYGAPSLPVHSNLQCSISHKQLFAVAAVASAEDTDSRFKIGTAFWSIAAGCCHPC